MGMEPDTHPLSQAFLFGPIWSTLYTFMGLASYLIWEAGTPLSALAFKLYGAQLIFNLAWQPLFFNLHNMEIAQIDNLGELLLMWQNPSTLVDITSHVVPGKPFKIVMTCTCRGHH